MAVLQLDIYSHALNTSVNVCVTLPLPDPDDSILGLENHYLEPGEKYQTLWLLHGRMADQTYWLRFSNVERYAQAKKLAVVMPAAGNSFYMDLAYGRNYFTFITEELPAILSTVLPLSRRREDNFIAGFSMGGAGAFMAALRHPERYAAAASLSGALRGGFHTQRRSPSGKMEDRSEQLKYLYGPEYENYDPEIHDLYRVAERTAAAKKALPQFYSACGTEDGLYEENIKMRDLMARLGYSVDFEDGPGGHIWDFWDTYIRRVIEKWLPLAGTPVKEGKSL